MDSSELLRFHPTFVGLSKDQFKTLSQATKEFSVQPGYHFFLEGDELKYYYLLTEGAVSIVIGVTDHNLEQKYSDLLNGILKTKDITVSTIEKGEFFGWSALIPPFIATAGAKAIKPCRVIAFDCNKLLDIFKQDGHLGYIITQSVAQVVRQRLQDLHVELLADLVETKDLQFA
jgi:CRP-like cAMP-binding protein